MNPNYVHTITLYLQQGGSWTRRVLHDCSYRAATTVVQNGTQATTVNTYTVRIPIEAVEGDLTVSHNDIVVLGECQDEITNETGHRAAEVLARNKPDAFRVTAFSRNTDHLMDKHYRLGG